MMEETTMNKKQLAEEFNKWFEVKANEVLDQNTALVFDDENRLHD